MSRLDFWLKTVAAGVTLALAGCDVGRVNEPILLPAPQFDAIPQLQERPMLDVVMQAYDGMPRRDSNGYVPPTGAEIAAMLELTRSVTVGGQTPSDFLERVAAADQGADAYNYDVVAFIEATTRDTLVAFLERVPEGSNRVPRGWGTYIYNKSATRKAVDVHVNHPLFDINTPQVGTRLFLSARGRWFLMAGTHRYANPDPQSDMARLTTSLFQAVYQQVAAGAAIAVSVHGYARTNHTGTPIATLDVVLSNGCSPGGGAAWTADAVTLRARIRALTNPTERAGLYGYDSGLSGLSGCVNPQGIYANANLGVGRWLHSEIASEIRTNVVRRERLADLIAVWAMELADRRQDTTAPDITSSVTGALGNSGWYTSDVSVSWTVTDDDSPVTSATGCDRSTLTTDTEGETFTCTATSGGGTATASVTVKRDVTPPVVAFGGNSGAYTVDQEVAITCTASDNASGVASETCADVSGPAYGFGLGSHTVSATATDFAGNVGSGSATFTVSVTFGSLGALTRSFVTHDGTANSLCAKIEAAAASAARGNTNAMRNQLQAYVNEVTAQAGKKVPAADAAVLIALAQTLM